MAVKVVPNSSRTSVVSFKEGILKVKIATPPEGGRANKALVGFLSKILKIKSIVIVCGEHSENKIIDFGKNYSEQDIIEKLLPDVVYKQKS